MVNGGFSPTHPEKYAQVKLDDLSIFGVKIKNTSNHDLALYFQKKTFKGVGAAFNLSGARAAIICQRTVNWVVWDPVAWDSNRGTLK